MMSEDKVVVLFSGGQDSSTCLAWALEKWGHDNVYPMLVNYDQRHAVELEQARVVARELDVTRPLWTAKLDVIRALGGTALTDPDVTVAAQADVVSGNAYAAERGLPSTFVPGRNLLFLTLAAAYGAKVGALNIVTGVCESDDAGYPDCRESFVFSAAAAINEALGEDRIKLHTPLIHRSKAATFALAQDLGVLDLIVEHTHTCYRGDRSVRWMWGYGCGSCPACNERAKGWATFTADPPSIGG